jgi:hypothetical protein
MQKRTLLSDGAKLVLLGVGLVLLVCGLRYWYTGEEAYGRVQVGRPVGEALGILEGHGYVLTGGDVDLGEAAFVYQRYTFEPPVVVQADLAGLVIHKERESPIDWGLHVLSDPGLWWPVPKEVGKGEPSDE